MNQYLDRKQVIELYEKYQPSMATHVYEFGEKLKALPIVEIPLAELDTTNDVEYKAKVKELEDAIAKCAWR